jgi:hypothetical protein
MPALCMVRPGVYSHFCPGCQTCHSFNVHDLSRDGRVIGWCGDVHRPSTGEPIRHEKDGRVCEYILRAGVIHYFQNCTHELAGKSVPMIDCPH